MEGKQFFVVTLEIDLGFIGPWTVSDVRESLENALDGCDGIEVGTVTEGGGSNV